MWANCSLQALKDSIWGGGDIFQDKIFVLKYLQVQGLPAQDLEASILRRLIYILMCNEWQEKNRFQRVSRGFCMQCFITAATTGYDKNYKSTLLKTSPKHTHGLSWGQETYLQQLHVVQLLALWLQVSVCTSLMSTLLNDSSIQNTQAVSHFRHLLIIWK